MINNVEVLSPAGSYESLKAAIAAGADAVYIGGTRFGARAFADNLTEEMLLEAIDYVHLHGKKIYLTINTLLKEEELSNELYQYLLPYYKQGLDAVIVQDIGVLKYVREQFPDLPVHASTQMTITNVLGAKFLEELGVERVVTAREMQLDEIKEISEQTSLEIESFVHGALCYCYSGQCLYSSLIGGRSGNRGQCAQPCRLPYRLNDKKENQYVLSLKDMCTLEYIPELIEAGIHSFKIEGRMKKPEYVALVTAMYRKYIDLYLKNGKSKYRVSDKDREKLMDIYNRGGSHGGYYYTKNGKEMVSLTRPNHAGVPVLEVIKYQGKTLTAKAVLDVNKGDVIELPDGGETYTFANDVKRGQTFTIFTRKRQQIVIGEYLNRTRNESLIKEIYDTIISSQPKRMIQGKVFLNVNEPAVLNVSLKDINVCVEGDVVQHAIKQPMEKERIEKQIKKTGNTVFEFDSLDIEMHGDIFVPMQSLNELRRNALELLENKIVDAYRRNFVDKIEIINVSGYKCERIPIYAYVETLEQLEESLECKFLERIYLDCNGIESVWSNKKICEYIEKAHNNKKELYFCMPHVFRRDSIQKFDFNFEHIFGQEWDGVLIRNYESYLFLKNRGYKNSIVTDYNLYQFNAKAKDFWVQKRVEATTAPLELNYKELAMVGLEKSELVVYGFLPMMVSAQCVKNTMEGCKKQKTILKIKDRYNKEFSVKNMCDYCYNVIYNTAPLVLTDQKEEILSLSPMALRLHFTKESKNQMREVLRLYEEVFVNDMPGREPHIEFTRGHFKRGVK